MKPRIIVSSCAIGNATRHNGGAKKQHWLTDEFGKHVEFIPLCPELSMGLGVPRESMRLTKAEKLSEIRLKTHKSDLDLTELALSTSKKICNDLSDEIHGIVLMGNSPTCGLESVKVYDQNNSPSRIGVGFFAQSLQERYPLVPMIEAGRLTDKSQAQHFINRVFIQFEFNSQVTSLNTLQSFHRTHKYLLMAYSPENLKKLGSLAANRENLDFSSLKIEYVKILFETLKLQISLGKLRNSFQHMFGYLKRNLHDNHKQYFLQQINHQTTDLSEYLTVISNLLNYENAKQNNPYIAEQSILSDHYKQIVGA